MNGYQIFPVRKKFSEMGGMKFQHEDKRKQASFSDPSLHRTFLFRQKNFHFCVSQCLCGSVVQATLLPLNDEFLLRL